MENGKLLSSDESNNSAKPEDGKENVNVVIVPESILQAIKSTPQFNLDVTDVINASSNQVKSSVNVNEETDCLSNIDLTNGNLWVSFPSESYCLGCESTSYEISTGDDNCDTSNKNRVTENSESTLYIENDSNKSQVKVDNSSNNCGVQLPLFQGCVLMPSFSSGEVSNTNSNELALCNSPLSSQLPLNSFISMKIQSVENDGDKKIYTLVPPSNNDETLAGAQSSSTKQQQGYSCVVNQGIEVQVSIDSNEVKNNNPILLKNTSAGSNSRPTVILCQPASNSQVTTADKATYASGNKPCYKCEKDNCNKVFKSALQYRKHVSTMHEKEKLYKCKYANCMWSFRTPYKLKRHLESHYKRKPHACPIPGCNVFFSMDYNLRAHLKIHAKATPERVCSKCDMLLSSKQELNTHMRKVHGEKPTFSCNVCGKQCHTRAALVIHKKSHSMQKLKYDCPVCEKKFVKRSDLKVHLYIHTGERPFQCDQCDWGFVSLSRLNRHMMTHKESRRFKCNRDNCDKQFHRFHHLVAHLHKVHKVQDYEDEDTLQDHLNEAKGGKQQYFPCVACGFTFLSAHGLARHKIKCEEMAVTAGDKQQYRYFTCDACGLKYLSPHGLAKHSLQCEEMAAVSEATETNQDTRLSEIRVQSVVTDGLKHNDSNEVAEESPGFLTANNSTMSPMDDSSLDQGINIETCWVDNEISISADHDESLDLITSSSLSGDNLRISSQEETVISDINTSWVATLLPNDDLSQNMHPSRYLACSAQKAVNTQMTLVPFMDDEGMLNDATTRQFLQLSEDLTSCVDPVSVAGAQPGNADMLQQYVIDSSCLRGMTENNIEMSISEIPHDGDPSRVQSANFFDDNIPLVSIDDARNSTAAAHFSGTTINLSDLQ